MQRLTLFLILLISSLAADPWSIESSFEVTGLSGVTVSPDGKEVVYQLTRTLSEEQENRNLTHLYKVPADGSSAPRQFTTGEASCFSPAWSPDGSQIAFLSPRNGGLNLFLIPTDGGEAVQITDHPTDIQGFIWSPDGSQIAFIAAQDEEYCEECFVYEERPCNHLWLLTLDSGITQAEQITHDIRLNGERYFGSGDQDLSWSPDGSEIAFAYTQEAGEDAVYTRSQVAIVDLESREIRQIGGETGCEETPRYSPDGKWLAYVRSDTPTSYAYARYATLLNRETGAIHNLAPTPNEGPIIGAPALLGWTADSSAVLFGEPTRTLNQVLAVPVDGSASQTLLGGKALVRFGSVNRTGTHLGLTIEGTEFPREVGVASLKDHSYRQLTEHNASLKKYELGQTKVVTWTNPDGEEVEGLLTLPPDYTPGKRYPCIVVVHGGPMGHFYQYFTGGIYPYPTAALAQEGFVVFRPNPRGSGGYGRAFRIANYADWGGGDFQDIMSGVDHLIEKQIVDGDRLGICGWSYGGYMTAWSITQTDRFKAASMGAGLANMVSFAGTTDIHTFLEDYMGGNFSEKRELYWQLSPIAHVDHVHTPCLIQHGSDDVRVPISQGQEFYRALKNRGVETQLVIYQGMGHGMGTPKAEFDVMQRNVEWFKARLL